MTIVTNRGHTFDIIRKSSTSGGGIYCRLLFLIIMIKCKQKTKTTLHFFQGYELLTAGFWASVKEPVVIQVT